MLAKAVTSLKLAQVEVVLTPASGDTWKISTETCKGLEKFLKQRAPYIDRIRVEETRNKISCDDLDLEKWFLNYRDPSNRNLLASLTAFALDHARVDCCEVGRQISEWELQPWIVPSTATEDSEIGVSWTGRYISRASSALNSAHASFVNDREWWIDIAKRIGAGARFLGFDEELYGFTAHTNGQIPLARLPSMGVDEFLERALSVKTLYCGQSAALAVRQAAKLPVVVKLSDSCPDVVFEYEGATYSGRSEQVERVVCGQSVASEILRRYRQ
jgi:hypothetical protein